MEQNEKESDNIELRSEKVRNVIGKVPPRLVSLGTVVITTIVLALAVAFYKIPYPISIDANGEVINQRTVQVFVPYKYLYLFDEPRTAHVSFEGNDNASCNCDITSHKATMQASMPRSRWTRRTSSFSLCPTMTALLPMSTAKRPTSCVWTRD